ncbi:YfiR family protein [Massilia endophytica]|uniref:YfiR family protein n=1 Tax=Massilia endophytica TaxID=2899220 RepID=UPI001E2FE02C|nr:YfiR family protein [Massilia endophytica]UGQ47996.1 YfiR family protein [Massilia endophytica]
MRATTLNACRSFPLAAAMQGWQMALLALVMACLTLSCLAGGAPPATSGVPALERSVKAAYLFKFLGYAEFSAEATGPLTVGILGADDIAAELARITEGRMVNGRPVAVRTLREGEPATGLSMLFVGADAERPLQALRSATEKSVLSVTEIENGLQLGAVINFRMVDERVRFEVSLPAAEKNNQRLSSRLLSVAYHIQKDKP